MKFLKNNKCMFIILVIALSILFAQFKDIIFPIIGLLIFIQYLVVSVLVLLKGTQGNNKYGPEPQGNDSHLGWMILFGVFTPLGVFWLFIFGVLSVGCIAGYVKAMEKYRINQTIEQIAHITANTHLLFSSSQSYNDLNDDLFKKAYLIPDDMQSSVGFKNVYGGKVTITPSSGSRVGDNKAFTITYKNIPQDACIYLATQDWPYNGFMALMVTNDEQYDLYNVTSNSCHNVTYSGIALSCGNGMPTQDAIQGCNTDSNTLIFKFY